MLSGTKIAVLVMIFSVLVFRQSTTNKKMLQAAMPSHPVGNILFINSNNPVDEEKIIPKETWVAMFKPFFEKWRMRLQNYQPIALKDTNDNTYKYYLKNKSSWEIGPSNTFFSVVPFRHPPATVYFWDMMLRYESMMVENGRMVVTMAIGFGNINQSHVLPANCIDDLACGANGNWKVILSNAKLKFYITPDVSLLRNGLYQFTFQNMEIRATGNIRSQGINTVVSSWGNADFFGKFTRRLNLLFNQAEYKNFFSKAISANAPSLREGMPFSKVNILPNGDMKVLRSGGGTAGTRVSVGLLESKDQNVGASSNNTITITPLSLKNLSPTILKNGDKNFNGKKVYVVLDYRYYIKNDKFGSYLYAKVFMSGVEDESDSNIKTTVEGNWDKKLYSAPKGYVIEEILRPKGRLNESFAFYADPHTTGLKSYSGAPCSIVAYTLSDKTIGRFRGNGGAAGNSFEPTFTKDFIITTEEKSIAKDDILRNAENDNACGFKLVSLDFMPMKIVLKRAPQRAISP